MDDDNLMDVNLTDLDLNQEPMATESVPVGGSILSELGTAHVRIEERIRQLEGVTARARQRQRWRQSRYYMEIGRYSGETMPGVDGERGILDGVSNIAVEERTPEKGKGCKRDSSYLVAKALEINSEAKKAVEKESGGSFYDCNICLEIAREPVLTTCGHLFCWACFYQVSNIDSTSKECPVCKGEVSDSTVIPIYGNGGSDRVCETELGLKIPPRPKARRVESVRQQRAAHGLSQVPVADALRRIRISIGAMGGHQTQQQEGGTGVSSSNLESGQTADVSGGRRIRIHQVSRVLSESAASLSSLSSALSSAERLVEDLETVINNQFSGNDVLTRRFAGAQSNNQRPDLTVDLSGSLPNTSSSQSTGEASPQVGPTYSLRRRSNVSRNSDVGSREARESRRRRFS